MANSITISASVQNMQVFEHPLFGTLRGINLDGEPWFVSRDACEGLKIDRTAIRRLDEDEKGVYSMHTPGGDQELSIVSFPGLLSLILGSRKKEAREYKRWVTHEVLPSIHKHGMYATAETAERLMQDPDFMIKTFEALKKERSRVKALEGINRRYEKDVERQGRQIEEMHPKALFADAVAASDSTILIGDLAKILKQNGIDTGQKRLFKWLRDNGWLMKHGSSRNMPTQKAMDLGLFRVKETTINNPDGSVRITKTTKVTGKGQRFFVNAFLEGRVA